MKVTVPLDAKSEVFVKSPPTVTVVLFALYEPFTVTGPLVEILLEPEYDPPTIKVLNDVAPLRVLLEPSKSTVLVPGVNVPLFVQFPSTVT